MSAAEEQPVCAVVGVGPGNGAAFARKFADEGCAVALLARNQDYLSELAQEIAGSRSYAYDATDPEAAKTVLSRVRDEMGPISTLLYNAGSGVFGDFDQVTADDLEAAWRVNSYGLLLAAKAVVPAMRELGGGNIVVTGATASLRGGANFAAFASAKAAQRSLAQSLARHLGKENIHVSYVVVDGVIDIPRTREFLPDRADEEFLDADDIASTVYFLTQQPKSAWLNPCIESPLQIRILCPASMSKRQLLGSNND